MFRTGKYPLINFRFSLPPMFLSTSAERQIQNYFTKQFDLSEFQCLHPRVFLLI